MLTQRKKIVFGTFIVLFVFNILSWSTVFALSAGKSLMVDFFDVGQGDAIFIETPQRYQILIDGGPDNVVLEKLGERMLFWDRTIDLVILTHPEYDHMAGLIEVLKTYEVKNILWTGIVRDTAEYGEWKRLIGEEDARLIIAQKSLRIHLDNSYIDVLAPFENLEGQEMKDSNNTSIVTRLVFGEKSFLFAGDIEKSMEKKLIESGAEIDSDVLKVAHHGSKTSSIPEFVEKVSPEVAVISVGKENKYGHPHEETLDTLGKYGIDILRTDLNGDIKIISSKAAMKILSSSLPALP